MGDMRSELGCVELNSDLMSVRYVKASLRGYDLSVMTR